MRSTPLARLRARSALARPTSARPDAWPQEARALPYDQLLVFIDGFDVDYGGCPDFQRRYEAIVRQTGASIVFAAELGCEAQVAWPPGCSGIPDPPPGCE